MTSLEATGRAGTSTRTLEPDERAARLEERAAGDNNAAAAFAAFAALTPKISAARTAVSSANFGPIKISDSCDYDCNFKEWHWWFEFDGRAALPFPGTLSAMDAGGVYKTAFGSVQKLLGTFATAKAALKAQVDIISAIDEKVIKEGGPTRQQVLDLLAAFKAAREAVTASESLDDTAIQKISSFETQYKGYKGALQAQATSTQQSFDAGIQHWRDKLLGDAKCGTGTLISKFKGVTDTVNASIASLSPSFAAANTAFDTAMTAVTRVLGNLVATQSSYTAVLDALAEAEKLAPTSPMRKIKLGIATTTFANLVTYADTNLKT